MRPVLFLLAIVLSGCSSTTVYNAQGLPALKTSADATNISYTGPGFAFHADRLDHSTPTIARSKLVNGYATGAAGIVTALGASALIH